MKINWNIYETVLLIKGYVVWQEYDLKMNDVIKLISEKLRGKAISNNIEIDDKYRNHAGINRKLRNIQYLFTNGEYGLPHYSKLELEVYNIYVSNNRKFQNLLEEAYEQFMMVSYEEYFLLRD